MRAPSTYMNPRLGQVPGVISLTMLFSFLRCLPRPFVGGPVAYGRQMILDALGAVDAFGPRDKFEAVLVMQIPTLELAAREVEAAAMAEPDFDRRMRLQRHMMALQRRAEGLAAEVRRHRRELAQQDMQHVSSPPCDYDLDALEAVWREPEGELPETALVVLPLVIPPGCFGMPMDGSAPRVVVPEVVVPEVLVPEVLVPEVLADGPDGTLEDRDEFEVEPPRRFQGVPKWKRAGRKYLDEMIEEERLEVVEAQLLRGEVIEEPPQRPEAWSEP